MRRLGLLLVPLLGAAAVLAALWLRERAAPPPGAAPTGAAAPVRDWYASGLEGWVHGADGALRHHLEARAAEGFTDGSLRMQDPRLELRTRGGGRWRLSARAARAHGGRVVLEGDVDARRVAGRRPLRLRTERLVAEPGRDYVETDLPVLVSAPRMRTEAVGMRAWLDRDRIELLREVRSRYGPRG